MISKELRMIWLLGVPMTWRKILEPAWKKLLFIIKNSKQDFISWRE